jgi:hypothetical protein
MWEAGRLTAAGTTVRVFAPVAQDLLAMGVNLMDAGRRREVFDTAVRTGAARLMGATPPDLTGEVRSFAAGRGSPSATWLTRA